MNLRWIDPVIVKLITKLSDELYGENRRGNKQRLIRDAVMFANENKDEFKSWINDRRITVYEALKRLTE